MPVSIMSPSRVSSLEKSGYEVVKRQSIAAPPRISERPKEKCPKISGVALHMANSWIFEAFFAVVIATNSLFIGHLGI